MLCSTNILHVLLKHGYIELLILLPFIPFNAQPMYCYIHDSSNIDGIPRDLLMS